MQPPLRKELRNFARGRRKTPRQTASSLRGGEEIEEVRKSGVTDKALKVGDRAAWAAGAYLTPSAGSTFRN